MHTKLYVGGLSQSVTELQLQMIFNKIPGIDVEDVQILNDKLTPKLKRDYAFVTVRGGKKAVESCISVYNLCKWKHSYNRLLVSIADPEIKTRIRIENNKMKKELQERLVKEKTPFTGTKLNIKPPRGHKLLEVSLNPTNVCIDREFKPVLDIAANSSTNESVNEKSSGISKSKERPRKRSKPAKRLRFSTLVEEEISKTSNWSSIIPQSDNFLHRYNLIVTGGYIREKINESQILLQESKNNNEAFTDSSNTKSDNNGDIINVKVAENNETREISNIEKECSEPVDEIIMNKEETSYKQSDVITSESESSSSISSSESSDDDMCSIPSTEKLSNDESNLDQSLNPVSSSITSNIITDTTSIILAKGEEPIVRKTVKEESKRSKSMFHSLDFIVNNVTTTNKLSIDNYNSDNSDEETLEGDLVVYNKLRKNQETDTSVCKSQTNGNKRIRKVSSGTGKKTNKKLKVEVNEQFDILASLFPEINN